ncbi:C-type lectin domain family 17, member A-like [Taeniopygia guttata]|uniref:C-type lectin domain family 17, member A-like n=1 Tax=Taeniopygia guttata TaxID=59729 RepID=UPI003BB91DD6
MVYAAFGNYLKRPSCEKAGSPTPASVIPSAGFSRGFFLIFPWNFSQIFLGSFPVFPRFAVPGPGQLPALWAGLALPRWLLLFLLGVRASWGRARAACEDLGAQLAVVSDEAEQLFLVQNSNRSSSYWLGVTDAEEGKWRWANGEEPQIGFWDVWLQEEQQDLKDCGTLGPNGRWASAACAEPLRWGCERPGHC